MAKIQTEILKKLPGFCGPVFDWRFLPAGLKSAEVHRGGITNGPSILKMSAGDVQPILLDKVREKLVHKLYQTPAPLELFAYTLHDNVAAFVNSKALIDECVNSHLPGSVFQAVRIFHYGKNELKFRVPVDSVCVA